MCGRTNETKKGKKECVCMCERIGKAKRRIGVCVATRQKRRACQKEGENKRGKKGKEGEANKIGKE
jgi:hypothetical protein